MPHAEGRQWSIPILHVSGVTVRLHVTFVLLLVLVALSAAAAGLSVLAEVGWLVVLFACVVVHELAHARVARARGLTVLEIVLLPIGGIAKLEHPPARWRDEQAIALAGPLASIGIGVVALLLGWAVGGALLPPSLADGPLLLRLGWVNLLLAVFNLLPALPLDGGRVLRAHLESRYGRLEATRRTGHVGRLVAWGMLAFGFVANPWLVVLGAFVVLAGSVEETAAVLHAALGSTPARRLAIPCPRALPADLPASTAARLDALRPAPAYRVVDAAGRHVGLVTPALLTQARAAAERVGEVAVLTTVDAETSLEDVLSVLDDRPVTVLDHGRVLGVITPELLEHHLRDRLHQFERDGVRPGSRLSSRRDS